MRALFEKSGFIICFEAQPEDISARRHFINECGWTEAQFRAIKDYAWFCAKVSAWKNGEEVGTAYLGCCSYKTEEEFYTRYKDDYFAQMVAEAIAEANEKLGPNMINLDQFLSGYIGAALWSTTDSRDEEGNDTYSLDAEFSDVSDKCKDAMRSDCENFIASNGAALAAFKAEAGPNCDDWRLGFLFWLNREGHGSGFWDELPSSSESGLGDQLSEASKPYGSFALFGDFEAGVVRSHHYG